MSPGASLRTLDHPLPTARSLFRQQERTSLPAQAPLHQSHSPAPLPSQGPDRSSVFSAAITLSTRPSSHALAARPLLGSPTGIMEMVPSTLSGMAQPTLPLCSISAAAVSLPTLLISNSVGST